jgi:ABC-2 type transport system permease protein
MVIKKRKISFSKKDALIRFALVFAILILLNVVSRFFFYRLDLTSEKRFSISAPTKAMVKNLKDVVTVKVYLDGELNAGFTKLKESTRNTLEELRAYGGRNIEFMFIDPMAIQNLDERKALMTDLMQRGLSPTNLTTKSKTDTKQQLIFPGAILSYGGREFPVQLLENQIGYSPQEVLNNSEVLLEYKFANAIQKLTQYRAPRVGFMRGHGELNEAETADLRQTLEGLQYEVKDFDLSANYYIPERFNAIVIAKPKRL